MIKLYDNVRCIWIQFYNEEIGAVEVFIPNEEHPNVLVYNIYIKTLRKAVSVTIEFEETIVPSKDNFFILLHEDKKTVQSIYYL